MNTKILIIGQAPPAVKQEVPYDTTMLYDWLSEIGISKADAQNLFEFEAMVGEFTGYDSNGHRKPTLGEMDKHYLDVLVPKIKSVSKIILLGNVPKEYFNPIYKSLYGDKKFLMIIHPSKRNYSIYQIDKESIIQKLKDFILLT